MLKLLGRFGEGREQALPARVLGRFDKVRCRLNLRSKEALNGSYSPANHLLITCQSPANHLRSKEALNGSADDRHSCFHLVGSHRCLLYKNRQALGWACGCCYI